MDKQSVLRSFLTAIKEGLSSSDIIIDDDTRRRGLLNVISLVGIFFLFLLGSLALWQGVQSLAAVDFMAAALLGGFVYLLRNKKYLSICIYCNVGLMFILFLYLLATGGVAGNAFVWCYTFPLISFFMLGARKGLLVSTIHSFFCLAVLLLDLNTSVTAGLYTKDFAFRFLSSYIVVILLVFAYELYRERSQKTLVRLNDHLEQQVNSRTAELRKEIHEKTRARATAVLAKEEWERTFNAVPDEIIILNPVNLIIRANTAACRSLKIPLTELIGTYCYKSIHKLESPPAYCPHSKILESKEPFHFEYFDDDRQRYFSVTASPLHDSKGAFVGSVRVARDITEQKKAQSERDNAREQLRKAEKMEAIGLMAGGVAHDLNNILSGVVSYPEILLLELTENDPLYEPLKAIQDSGKRAAAVVADLLTVARGVATVCEVCSLNTIVEEFINSPEFKNAQSFAPQVDVALELAPELWNIKCSPVHIQKILLNLVINGIEAIGSSGYVSVSTENMVIGAKKTTDLPHPGEYVVLRVMDTGKGIPAGDHEKIFEPFYTKKVMGRSGTGLGLAVVWNIVRDHGAVICVNSDKNGTAFTLYFPATSEKTAQLKTAVEFSTLRGDGSILIVDDDLTQRKIASQMLNKLGYSTVSVSSGEEAITFFMNNSVDLVLLDMLMGVGINGLQTYKKIIALSPGQKAVIASGFSASKDVEEAIALGAACFLKKPYSIEQLGSAVKSALS